MSIIEYINNTTIGLASIILLAKPHMLKYLDSILVTILWSLKALSG